MDNEGVSAVVGTLLIVGMLMLAAVGVLYWGVPAIRELRDRSTFDHVAVQASRFNEELRGLVLKGDPQNAARPTMVVPGGTLQVTAGHRVVVAFMIEAPDFAALPETTLVVNPYNVFFWGWGDDDRYFELKNVGKGVPGLAGVFGARLTVYEVAGGVQTKRWAPPIDAFPEGAARTVDLGANYDMSGKVLRVIGENVSALGASAQFLEAWMMDAGAVEYEIGTGAGLFGFALENGALILERKGDTFFEQPPFIQFPDLQVNHETFTWRFLQLSGATGAGGTGSARYPFFLSLVQNEPRLEGPAASLVRLYVNGTNEVAWWNLLDGLSPRMVKLGEQADDGLQFARKVNAYQFDPFRVKLVHSEVLVRVTPGG